MHNFTRTVSEITQSKMAANSLLYHHQKLTYFKFVFDQSKEEGKYKESIQSSTMPDPGHHM